MLKRHSQHKLTFPILSLLWVFVILWFSLQDGSTSSLQSGFITANIQRLLSNIGIDVERQLLGFLIRKTAHFTEFFILGVLVKRSAFDLKNNLILYLSFLVPIIDETVQSFVPGRAMTLMDMLIDSAGISTGIIAVYVLYNIILNKHTERED